MFSVRALNSFKISKPSAKVPTVTPKYSFAPIRSFNSASSAPKFSFQPSFTPKVSNFQFSATFSITKSKFFSTEEVKEPYTTTANVFISNLPFSVSPRDLRENLRQYGYIVRLNLLKNADGNPNGKAIIEFGNEESGANLINNPPVVDGRQVLSRAFRSGTPILSDTRVVVSNVPYKTTEADFASELSAYGEVSEVKFLNTVVGKFKGVVAISFSSAEAAARFIHEKNNSQYNDRTIYARYDTLRRDERPAPVEQQQQ